MKNTKKHYMLVQQFKECHSKTACKSRVPIIKHHLKHSISANNMVKEQFYSSRSIKISIPNHTGDNLNKFI